MPEERARQTEALRTLSEDTRALRESIEHSPVITELQESQRKMRNILILVVIMFVGLAGAFVWLWTVADKAETAADDAQTALEHIKGNAVTNCQNANETRRGQRQWADFILDASDDGGAVEHYIISELRNWTNQLFADRDCSDLDRIYKVPERPNLKQLIKEAKS